ncbi:hypothetical protein [Streptomyces sp. NPDC015345]|uniref:hypothetical protein n=1 Tax=Streptomyces sp. NPDC015345 TaxID=3364953 RepID=UPI0036F78ABF
MAEVLPVVVEDIPSPEARHIGTGSSSTSAGAAVPRAQLAQAVRRLLMDSALTWTAPNSSDA